MIRKADPVFVNFIDSKLASNGLAQHAIETKDARLLFGLAAESCVGIKEKGHNKGVIVEAIQRTIGKAEGEPYCLGFVQACLAYAELKTGARSPIAATEHCRTCWAETPKEQRVKISPLKYAIVLWGHEGTSSGHAGIVIEVQRNSAISTVEANTNASGSREGDGIFYKKRDWIRNGDLIKLGFLRPF